MSSGLAFHCTCHGMYLCKERTVLLIQHNADSFAENGNNVHFKEYQELGENTQNFINIQLFQLTLVCLKEATPELCLKFS